MTPLVLLLGLLSPNSNDSDFQQLAGWMQGSFSSQVQSKSDATYFDVRLEMVRIWPEQKEGVWLYVEQAMATSLDKPYRQRVYHLTRVGDKFKSAVYLLPGDALKFAGAAKDVTKLKDLSPEKLVEKKGCHIIMNKHADGTYQGSTEGKGCLSDLRGATYATSKVKVTATGLETWDQGFDASDKQVWGATKGPYLFEKTK